MAPAYSIGHVLEFSIVKLSSNMNVQIMIYQALVVIYGQGAHRLFEWFQYCFINFCIISPLNPSIQLSQQLQEKCDLVDQLEERVKLLQQREQDQSLSGDERLLALQKEVKYSDWAMLSALYLQYIVSCVHIFITVYNSDFSLRSIAFCS